jgi:cytochrome c oxidase subunit 2
MFAEVIWFPEQASTTAHKVDQLLIFLVVVTGTVGLMVAVLLIGFAIRFRRRPGDQPPPEMRGNKMLEIFWTLTPLVFFVVMFGWGAWIYFDAFRAPDNATVIYGVGKQWMWKFQHPEGQREINELHVQLGRPVKIMLTSEDVIHSFFVPDFRVHMDVLPVRYTSVWFHPTRTGTYHLFCSQYCGTNHAGMVGTVHVLPPEEYGRWLQYHAEGSMALRGRQVFLKYRCISCHTGDASARAPSLEDLYDRTVTLSDGKKVTADDDYIKESIWDPGAKIVVGYQNIMPTFKGQVSSEEINELIAWLKVLKRGQTPPRVEESEPPAGTPPINPFDSFDPFDPADVEHAKKVEHPKQEKKQ